jgi:hypothetical protein
LKIATGVVIPTPDQLTRGDVAPIVNGKSQPDGKIDLEDVRVILQIAIGEITL